MQSRAGTDEFVTCFESPPVVPPGWLRRYYAGPHWRQVVHELRPSCVRVSAVEYKGHLIEAFEDQPGRWFAYFRRLDGRNITGAESNSLRTPSARYSKEDA